MKPPHCVDDYTIPSLLLLRTVSHNWYYDDSRPPIPNRSHAYAQIQTSAGRFTSQSHYLVISAKSNHQGTHPLCHVPLLKFIEHRTSQSQVKSWLLHYNQNHKTIKIFHPSMKNISAISDTDSAGVLRCNWYGFDDDIVSNISTTFHTDFSDLYWACRSLIN